MKIKQEIIIFMTLFVTIVSMGVFLPAVFSEHEGLAEAGYITAVPTSTPIQPWIGSHSTPSQTPVFQATLNCTYHIYYWIERPQTWPTQVVLGDVVYTREEILEIYQLGERDAASQVVSQLYIAFLNVLNGADMATVEGVIQDANNWLILNPPGSKLSEFNYRRGIELAELLEGYNLGWFGPGACMDTPPTPILRASFTSTPTPVITAPPAQTDRE